MTINIINNIHKYYKNKIIMGQNELNEEKNSSLYSLIDRLQKLSEWKYPERKWTNDFYYECAFLWKGKEKELEEIVLKLENDMRLASSLCIIKTKYYKNK